MKNLFPLLLLIITSICISSCDPNSEDDGCDIENDCLSVNVDGETFYAVSTAAEIISILGNTTLNLQGNTDVSNSSLLAVIVNLVDPAVGTYTVTAQNSSQKKIRYFDESEIEYTLDNGTLTILQYNTDEILIEGTFSGNMSSIDNGDISVTEGSFIVNQP